MFRQLKVRSQVVAMCSLLLLLNACQKSQHADQAATPSSVAAVVDNSVLSDRIREALLANDDVKSLAIKVKAENGLVVLSGFVNSQHQIDLSMQLAGAIPGVNEVHNEMSIKDATTPANEKIGDDLVTSTVKTALMNDSALKSLEIAVVTRHGEVMLSGFVDTQAQALRGVEVTQGVEGVATVLNHMTVKVK